jgi:hypothetical protein
MVGLALSFTALIRGNEGALLFLLAGVALLVTGSVLLLINRRAPTSAAAGQTQKDRGSAPTEVLHGAGGYVAIVISIALCIGMTIYVLAAGLDGSILFLLWIVVGGFAFIFLARRLTQRSNSSEED